MDPNVTENKENSKSDLVLVTEENDNFMIIYITIGVVIAIFVIWIVIVMFTGDGDSIKIIQEMTTQTSQIKPVSDFDPNVQTQL